MNLGTYFIGSFYRIYNVQMCTTIYRQLLRKGEAVFLFSVLVQVSTNGVLPSSTPFIIVVPSTTNQWPELVKEAQYRTNIARRSVSY